MQNELVLDFSESIMFYDCADAFEYLIRISNTMMYQRLECKGFITLNSVLNHYGMDEKLEYVRYGWRYNKDEYKPIDVGLVCDGDSKTIYLVISGYEDLLERS